MFQLGIIFIFISLIGFCGMTFAPALCSWFFYLFKKNNSSFSLDHCKKNSTIDILIPVHNQPLALEETLKNLSQFKIFLNIFVGLNACTDETESIAQRHNTKTIIKIEPGKWGMLRDLIANAKSDWVVLMDSGTLLPSDFFTKLNLNNCSSTTIGIAPRYYPEKLGIIQKIIWIFESLLKKLENISGGPISAHGACVVYKREKLQETISSLGDTKWLNDDVVIPLWLRFKNPWGKIIYRYDICIDDFDVHSAPPSPARRKRLVKGNLDLIKILLPQVLKSNIPLFTLCTRRVFRVLWAWWLSLFYLGLLFISASYSVENSLFLLQIFFVVFIFIVIGPNELSSALISSLLFFKHEEKDPWK